MTSEPHPAVKLPVIVTLFVLLVTGFYFHTLHNDYPFYYTPMEQTKTHQVTNNKPNFKHPALIITTTRTVAFLGGLGHKLKRSHQQIVQIGRTLNAVYAAVALLSLMLLAFYHGGYWTIPTFGITALMSLNLLEQAHMMKEEVAFLMGITLVYLSTWHLSRNPSAKTLILTALASGIALSAKWPGILVAGLALVLVFRMRSLLPARIWQVKNWRIGPLQAFLLVFATVFLVLNHQLLFHIKTLFKGTLYELQHVAMGRGGKPLEGAYRYYLEYFLQDIPLLFKIFFAVYIGRFIATYRQRTAQEWLEAGFFVLFLTILLLAKAANHRYFLSVEILMLYFATKGLFELLALLKPHLTEQKLPYAKAAASVLVLLLTVAMQGPVFARRVAMLANDSRHELLLWVNENLPETAVLAADFKTGLPSPNNKFTKIALEEGWVPPVHPRYLYSDDKPALSQYESVQTLRAMGVTHVAVLKDLYVENNGQEVAPFYRQISRGKLLWEWVPRDPVNTPFLDMAVQLWDIQGIPAGVNAIIPEKKPHPES